MGLTDRIAGLVERDPGRADAADEMTGTRCSRPPPLVGAQGSLTRGIGPGDCSRPGPTRRRRWMSFTAAAMNDVDRLWRRYSTTIPTPPIPGSQMEPVLSALPTWSGSHEALEMLMKRAPRRTFNTFQYGNSVPPLRIAAGADDTVSCRLLLEHGAAFRPTRL